MASPHISRRQFISTAGAGSAALSIPVLTRANGKGVNGQRPNIVVLNADDLSPHLGCYGDTKAKTPNIDALAQKGVVYTNAFVSCPVCSPSRACWISGRYANSFGTQNHRSSSVSDRDVQGFTVYMRDAGYFAANNGKGDFNFNPGNVWGNEDQYPWRSRNGDEPFYFQKNYTITHEGKMQGVWDYGHHNPADMEIPPFYPDNQKVREFWANYYDHVTEFDSQIGTMIGELEKDNLMDDTIIFVTGDHGAGLPRHKRYLYDSGIRVPMVVYIPEKFRVGGQGQPGTYSDELVSWVDMGPTIMNLTGVPIRDNMQGRAFLGENLTPEREYIFAHRDRIGHYDLIRAVRDKKFKYLRNYEWWKPYIQWSDYEWEHGLLGELRARHKDGSLNEDQELLFRQSKPLEELYDIENDPHELRNLADSPEHQATLNKMRAACIEWSKEIDDIGFIPEQETYTRANQAGSHYKVAISPTHNQVEKYISTIQLSESGPSALNDLLAACDDPDAAVRFWAARGLAHIKSQDSAVISKLKSLLNDSSAEVRVIAARGLVLLGSVNDGLDAFKDLLNHNDKYVRLRAIRVIDQLGNLCLPIKPQLEAKASYPDGDSDGGIIGVAERAVKTLDEPPILEPDVSVTPVMSRKYSGDQLNHSHLIRIISNKGKVIIDSRQKGTFIVEVINLSGRCVVRKKFNGNGEFNVVPRPLTSGVYTVKISTRNSHWTQKLIINH